MRRIERRAAPAVGTPGATIFDGVDGQAPLAWRHGDYIKLFALHVNLFPRRLPMEWRDGPHK
jgi:hypothetical protein